MPVVVAFVSQKGGVGKSTLARALAAVAAEGGVKVLVADLDEQQSTILHWERLRRDKAVAPAFPVKGFATIEEACVAADEFDLLIVDTSGRASRATLEIARQSHLIVQPTGPGLDDLRPGVLLFHELVEAGVPRSRLTFALCRTATKDEDTAARTYLGKAEYRALPGSVPDRAAYRAAHNTGRTITETDDSALNARAEELLAALLDQLKIEVDALKKQSQAKLRRGKDVA